jgi:hypothetical protein
VNRKKNKFVQLSAKATREFALFAAVRDLPSMARFIYEMALENDAKFFKQLGKALSGRKYTGLRVNRREAYMLEYYLENPNGTNADCMARMTNAKFPEISEDNFRVLKKRLFAKIVIIRNRDEFPQEGEWFGVLLDRNKF